MNERELREAAFEANLAIVRGGLVLMTWGNASACDRNLGLLAIKPSGVPYEQLASHHMVVVELDSGKALRPAGLRPSSDTPTHRALYLAFPGVGGIVHTHSRHATAWAQAGRDIPCLGTTHADYFNGPGPCTPPMTEAEIQSEPGYEESTGAVIVREFQRRGTQPLEVPGVLVHGHAPFAWGPDPPAAVHNAIVLESIAEMALDTMILSGAAPAISDALRRKHFFRKHGPGAYYGQPKSDASI